MIGYLTNLKNLDITGCDVSNLGISFIAQGI
jgi:Leucine-rich repeat (LRR) protein